MSDNIPLEFPAVTDDDIRWASGLLHLPAHAFFGETGADPRQDVLKSMESIDVAACPGSGKTTLLVAKLAILAEKWQYQTRGICVLSHTNAARDQIEKRLGNAAAGRRLLSYPHFVGTIHHFVNEFLALPWLRSRGYTIKRVDTEVTLRRRWHALASGSQFALQKMHHGPSTLVIKTPDYSVGDVRWRNNKPLGTNTQVYRDIWDVCRRSAQEGYHCYDEMFVWAGELVDSVKGIGARLCDRFPVFFIDEAQDNSEHQSFILQRVFVDPGSAVIRQRFGDSNQAVFSFVGGQGATADTFPCDEVQAKALPNSHRFGQSIAGLAEPLGCSPYTEGLSGQGPRMALASGLVDCPHTIFMFDNASVGNVLSRYANLLVDTFSEYELLKGVFSAVGMVHRSGGEEDGHKFPHQVGHYWSHYDPRLTSRDPEPETFVEYVIAGQAAARNVGEAYVSVEKIAAGVLRCTSIAGHEESSRLHRYYHRKLRVLLEGNAGALAHYGELISVFGLEQRPVTKDEWDSSWRDRVKGIIEAITGTTLLKGDSAESFLEWPVDSERDATPGPIRRSGENIYLYPDDAPKVRIRVGSIHSVKGETHTATLVLETFWYDHSLESLLPWLTGVESGSAGVGSRMETRLKVHYVAMTRPTHLLCLAMKDSTFQDGKAADRMRALQKRGWSFRTV